MSNRELDIFNDPSPREGSNIDIKRIIFRAVHYWYIIFFSLIIALIGAYLRNRYATRIYPVTASIIIKENQETSEGKLLYNNPLVSYYRNYLNELYIIRSYPLIQNVLEELNFGVSFYKEGNFLTTEAYNYIPVQAFVVDDNGISSKKLVFRVLNESEFELECNGDCEDINTEFFAFDDTIHYAGLDLLFKRKPGFSLGHDDIGAPFTFYYTRPSNLTGLYVSKLQAEWAEEGAGVVNLSINGANPIKDIDFLNGLIREYQEYDLEKKNRAASRAIEFITDQLRSISDSLRLAESQLEMFKNENVVTDLSAEALRLYEKIENLESQKTEVIVGSNYYKYLQEYIQNDQNLDQVILPSSVGINDVVLVTLISKMVDLQIELKSVLSREKTSTPIIEGKRRRLIEIKQDIIESIMNQRSIDDIKLGFLNKGIKSIEQQLNNLPVAERRLISIKRNYTLLENLYVFLLQKRAEADISKASTTTDIAVVNPPMMAGGMIAPKTNQNYFVAVLVGLSLPFFVLLLIEFFNTRVQAKEDVEKLTSMPFIGGIGHKKGEDNMEVMNNPRGAIAESFRALRSNLNYFTEGKSKVAVLITSSVSGEGKTFASINLASVFALSGKRTLIVGADMRRPRLYDDFKLHNATGLSSFLAGLSDFDKVIQSTSYENLDMVSGGPVPPNPAELMLTDRMEVFINEARKRYEYVVIDSPPMSLVTDAFALIGFVDHTLFLVRQNYTSKTLLKGIEEIYVSGRLKNVSILLNDIYKSGPGYGYGYAYGYAKEDVNYYS